MKIIMSNNERIVWGVEYAIILWGHPKKDDWSEPIGVYGLSKHLQNKLDCVNSFAGRPFFFRTREEAREEARRQKWKGVVAARAKKYILSWREA